LVVKAKPEVGETNEESEVKMITKERMKNMSTTKTEPSTNQVTLLICPRVRTMTGTRSRRRKRKRRSSTVPWI
jgi:hypothetical protein